jgi:NADPH-dependent glutamate synthase beta subunit-like oxidoreductase
MSILDQIIEKRLGSEPPYCQARCPLHVDVKGYMNLIREGKYREALTIIKSTLPFPAVMGRICTRPLATPPVRQKGSEVELFRFCNPGAT